MATRRFTTTIIGALLLCLLAGPAAATHVHGKELPNGSCVLLAADGGEKDVQLPNADEFGPTRQHPLHAKVHLGVPGEDAQSGTIFVAIGDDGSLTADALERCDGEFANAP